MGYRADRHRTCAPINTLDRLERSPANVRRTEAGQTAFAELKASIAAHGLLENLVARSIDPGEDGGEHYAVIAGARRLAALNDLAKDGVLPADHPVPCRVIDNGSADSELSLAETRLHPSRLWTGFPGLSCAPPSPDGAAYGAMP